MFALAMAGEREKACRRSVVCRGKFGEWVKEIVASVWSVGAKRASGSRELSLACGLSGRKGRVGQEACRWRVVCRAKTLRGSRDLSLACGLSGRKGRVGQGNCRRRVVCRGEKGEWVKRIVGGVWFVGAKRASGSRGLSLVCGLSGRKGRVGQEACRWYVVCRGENAAWVKRPVGGVWSGGRNRCVGQENCRWSVVCRGEKGE